MRAGERGKTTRSRGAHAPGCRNWRSASGSAAAKTHGGSLRRGSGDRSRRGSGGEEFAIDPLSCAPRPS